MKTQYIYAFLLVTFISLPSFGQDFDYSHDEIVQIFEDFQQGRTQGSVLKPPYMDQYIIPPLNDVIPKHLQDRIRSRGPVEVKPFDEVSASKDFRHRDTPILSQIGGRCSAYGLVASMENLLGVPLVAKISESHLWSRYRRYSSEAAVETAKRMSITESAFWPHDGNARPGWEARAHTALTHITYIEDDVNRAVKALSQGRPVYLGVSVTRSMERCEVVMDPMSPNTGGGHAVSISGYALDSRVAGGGYFIIKNSWSRECGDKGYQYMPFNYCIRGGNSYCIMWDVQGVKTAFPGVQSVEPKLPEFNMRNINVDVWSYRRWWRSKRTVYVKLTGDSLHARQIKEVSISVDGGAFRRPVPNDLDVVNLSFSTRATSHNIVLRVSLINGKTIESTHRWSI
jgi:hypothetical protein